MSQARRERKFTQIINRLEEQPGTDLNRDLLKVALSEVDAPAITTEQQSPVGIEDSTGSQVDPALATDYPDTQVSGEDIIANGDLVIGPVPVQRSSGVTIAANSTDGNTFSVSVDWVDSSGNIYQEESSTDIQLSAITQDFARLVRKAPQAQVTVTDDSGATQNNINIHVDTQR
jgi:hypothetical protein